MNSNDAEPSRTPDWLRGDPDDGGRGLEYLGLLRRRLWLLVLGVLITTGAALAYVQTAEKTYESHAELLITPIARDNPALSQIGLIRESTDPTQAVQTVARLVTRTEVAARARRTLGTARSPRSLLGDVEAVPVAQSEIVDIAAEARTASEAARIANAFAEALIAERSARFQQRLRQALARMPPQLRGRRSDSAASVALSDQAAQLRVLRGRPDPTIQVASAAQAPDHASSPRVLASIGAAIAGGLVLGLLLALLAEANDRRLRRVAQLSEVLDLPVLSRAARDRTLAAPRRRLLRWRKAAAIPARRLNELSPEAAESFRRLRMSLGTAWSERPAPYTVLVTGPAPGEGTTTVALNLAASLAAVGGRTLYLEMNLRRPAVGKALGVPGPYGTQSVLVGRSALADTIVTSETYGPNLSLLLAQPGFVEEGRADALAFQRLLRDATGLAEYVVIDAGPLTEVIDNLPLARWVQDVLVVARLDHSRVPDLRSLGELLTLHDIRPTGVVVVGGPRRGTTARRRLDYEPQRRQVVESRDPAAGASAEISG